MDILESVLVEQLVHVVSYLHPQMRGLRNLRSLYRGYVACFQEGHGSTIIFESKEMWFRRCAKEDDDQGIHKERVPQQLCVWETMGIHVIEAAIPFREAAPVLFTGLLMFLLVQVVIRLRRDRQRVGAAVIGTLLGLVAAALNEAFGPRRTCPANVDVPVSLTSALSDLSTYSDGTHLSYSSGQKGLGLQSVTKAYNLTYDREELQSMEHVQEQCGASLRARSDARLFFLWLFALGLILARFYLRKLMPQQHVGGAHEWRPVQWRHHERAWG